MATAIPLKAKNGKPASETRYFVQRFSREDYGQPKKPTPFEDRTRRGTESLSNKKERERENLKARRRRQNGPVARRESVRKSPRLLNEEGRSRRVRHAGKGESLGQNGDVPGTRKKRQDGGLPWPEKPTSPETRKRKAEGKTMGKNTEKKRPGERYRSKNCQRRGWKKRSAEKKRKGKGERIEQTRNPSGRAVSKPQSSKKGKISEI